MKKANYEATRKLKQTLEEMTADTRNDVLLEIKNEKFVNKKSFKSWGVTQSRQARIQSRQVFESLAINLQENDAKNLKTKLEFILEKASIKITIQFSEELANITACSEMTTFIEKHYEKLKTFNWK